MSTSTAAELPTPVVPRVPLVSADDSTTSASPSPTPGLLKRLGFVLFIRPAQAIGHFLGTLVGLVVVWVGLAMLAAIPVLQFLTLGYLLESSGRLARTGRWTHAVPGFRRFRHLGLAMVGLFLLLLPLWFLEGLRDDARLMDPHGPLAEFYDGLHGIISLFLITHAILALVRGARLTYFLWPIGNFYWAGKRIWNGGLRFSNIRQFVTHRWRDVQSLRLDYYFSLGMRGFLGAVAWLALPALLLSAGPNRPVVAFLGGLLMLPVIFYLPFLQTQFAREQRWRDLFSVRAIRQQFQHAPLAYTLALVMTLVFSVPLFLLKIEPVPAGAAWLLALAFVLLIWPAKALAGWAVYHAHRRQAQEKRARFYWCWPARLFAVPWVIVYVYIVFLSQYTGWRGRLNLVDQHAFLLPSPF